MRYFSHLIFFPKFHTWDNLLNKVQSYAFYIYSFQNSVDFIVCGKKLRKIRNDFVNFIPGFYANHASR